VGPFTTTIYTLTATNAVGSSSASATVVVAPANLVYSPSSVNQNLNVPITPLKPTSSGGAAIAYSVSPALPSGLALDGTTGIISGTPAAASAAKTYVVSATNLAGTATASLTILVRAAEAQRIANRLEFHYTPKHASWLNMVEIEIGVLRTMCLDRRISDRPTLEREVAACVRQRNASKARVRWLFDVEQARRKMGRAYPKPAAPNARAAA